MADAMDIEDRALVGAFLRSRDELAFRALYRRHTRAMYGLAVRLQATRGDADETAHMAWIRAAESFGAFRWDSTLRTWLLGIVVNCAREVRKRAVRGAPSPLDVPSLSPASPEASAATRLDLDRAIGALPEGAREVLLLHDFEGLSHDEIGRLLGINEGTSKSQLFHARRAVRERLGEIQRPSRSPR